MNRLFSGFNSSLLTLLSLTALSSLIVGCSDNSASVDKMLQRPVKLYTVTDSRGQYSRTFPAKVSAAKTTNLSFRINGKLKQLNILSGQKIKRGATIARLDDKDIRQDLKNATSAHHLAKSNYDRNLSLLEKGLISQSVLDNDQRQLQATEASLDKAKNHLSYSVLKAPFSGVIAKINVENFQTIGANQSIAILQGENLLEVTVQVPESIIISLKNDGTSRNYHPEVVFSSMSQKRFTANYKEHATSPNPGSQTYDVSFTLEAPKDLTIFPGMTASLLVDLSKISRESHANTLIIPNAGVVQIDGEQGSYVWKYSPETQQISKQAVTLGAIQDTGIEIIQGLKPKDKIVTAGLNLLKEGMKVKPLDKERGL